MASRQMNADARAIRDKYNADLRAAGKASASNTAAERFEMIDLADLRESPLNPRKHFNAHRLEELAASIAECGVITPFPEYGGKDLWELFVESLKRFGVDFKDIEKQVKAELQEAAAEKKKGAGK